MAVKWTRPQADAIEKTGNLVVSAGAGSGKTAVLVEKVIRLITDKNADIDDILVVTFTKAATADVKEKIIGALYDRIAAEPDNKHLQRQVTKVGNASIDTINAFCLKIVRRYFDRLNISNSFRILDENESKIIREEVLDECITAEYRQRGQEEGFKELVSQLCERRGDEGLKNAVTGVLDVLETTADEEKYRSDVLEHLSDGNMFFEDAAREELVGQLGGAVSLLKSAAAECSAFPDLEKAEATLCEEATGVEKMLAAASEGLEAFAETYNGFSFGIMRFPNKFDDPDFKERIKSLRDEAKRIVGLIGKYAVFTEEDIRQDKACQMRIAELLFEITDDFRAMLTAKKADMSAADFSDVEKMTYALLIEKKDGETVRTETARELSANYRYIFVDEYQDTNELQDSIFKALQNDGNSTFVVGDVKQSIYGFRSACPELFAGRIAEAGENGVFLNHNFRSRKKITDGVNSVFEKLMTVQTGGIDYDENQKLKFGAEYYDESGDCPCELHLVDGNEKDEFDCIVRTVRDIVTKENYVYDRNSGKRRAALRDIAILMRSPKRSSATLEKMLCDAGLPAYAETQPVFFGNEEIVLATSMLEIIDNPLQDTHFATVLSSPIGGFTEDELVGIRLADKKASFYGAFKKYAESSEKAKDFLDRLNALRTMSLSTSVAGILTCIYDEFSLMTVAGAMRNGSLRKTNLRLLLEYATEYENTGFKGIFNFNLYLKRIKESGREMSGAKAYADDSDVVRIMSMHKSKGLEYPIVILAQSNMQFNLADTREGFIASRKFGMGMKLRDTARSLRYDTLQRLCLSSFEKNELISEEIRLWYVAMTRAKERLIVTASVKKQINTIVCQNGRPMLWSLRNAASPVCMLYSVLMSAGLENTERISDGVTAAQCVAAPWRVFSIDPSALEEQAKIPKRKSAPAPSEQQVRKNLSFKYPYSVTSGFPSKTSVSSIKKLVELKKDEDTRGENVPTVELKFERPAFVTKGTKLTAAERGTALHAFLQYADFHKLADREEIESELKRLADGGFITVAQKDSVSIDRVFAFGRSKTLREAAESGTMQRERRFNIKTDVGFLSSLTGEKPAADPGELVIMQGVIDCLYEKNGVYTVLDYKTDSGVGKEQLREKYGSQLKLYAYAVREITGCGNVKTVLYSFSLGEEIII